MVPVLGLGYPNLFFNFCHFCLKKCSCSSYKILTVWTKNQQFCWQFITPAIIFSFIICCWQHSQFTSFVYFKWLIFITFVGIFVHWCGTGKPSSMSWTELRCQSNYWLIDFNLVREYWCDLEQAYYEKLFLSLLQMINTLKKLGDFIRLIRKLWC